MRPDTYDRFAGICAILAGLDGLMYSIAFVAKLNSWAALFLMLGGGLASAALVAVYARLRETEPSFALWAFLLGVVGAAGAAIHGGYDLANAINPPGATSEFPSGVDPRGLLTFGVAGLALVVVSTLIVRGRRFPVGLGYLGYVLAVLLLVIYLGRLIILDANNPALVGPAVLAGILINPAWYIWLGISLLSTRATPQG